jgi:hypothetical protein
MITARRSGEGRDGDWATIRVGQRNAKIARRHAEMAVDIEAHAGWARDDIGLI